MFFLLKLLLSPKAIVGMAVGAATVWFADPTQGSQRRADALDAVKGRTTTPDGTVQPTLWTPADSPAAEAI